MPQCHKKHKTQIIFSPLEYQRLGYTTQILLNETHAVVLPPWLNSSGRLTCPREKWLSQATVSPNSQQLPSVYKHHCLKSLAYTMPFTPETIDHFPLSLNDIKKKKTKPSTHTQSSVFSEQRESKELCGVFFPLKLTLRKIMGNC